MNRNTILKVLDKGNIPKSLAETIVDTTDNYEVEIREDGKIFYESRYVFDIEDNNTQFKVIGMFINLPEKITINDVILYFSGFPLSQGDIGEEIGGHIITAEDVENLTLRCIINPEDVGKIIGGVTLTKEHVNKTPVGIIPTINDIGKTVGGIKITDYYIGSNVYLEGVRMTINDIGKVIGATKITSKDVGKMKTFDIKKHDLGKTIGDVKIGKILIDTTHKIKVGKNDVGKRFGGILLESIFIGNSLGGINFYQSGYDSPIYIKNRYSFEMVLEISRNELEAVEGAIKCNKCGSTETISLQKQTRSSDEPMTTFWKCVKCNHGGKIGG